MTLKDDLMARIAATGPISVADFMSEALLHPTKGYYTTRDPLGAQGDFVTAPEISQMFGELVGLSLAQSWLDQGAPERFTLAELGPGRGTLMADILRATRSVPGFHDAANIHLVEASPVLQDAQAATLVGHAPTWVSSVNDLPAAPLWLVANEFFDALPIRQFERAGSGWRERCVGLTGDALGFGLAAPAPRADLEHRLEDTGDGDVVEVCPTARTILNVISSHIAAQGGAALIIDYGDWRSQGDTLQAVQNHAAVDPLADPGRADLTAHVDFEVLATATAPASHSRVTPQGVFLERLGITARAQQLAQKLTGRARETHIAAHRRLTHPQEMGNLFKVLGVFPATSAPPPGLTK
ncbi:class I SAM-dependent methyltransferase [Tateyamaria pelophila]|uniref:class I SAM-dependent methyltransferase n=1 Tax=Tateyamaria pelophila TaxID=328415 RepID=UPI001CC00894|nr:SAM-dependent methyltransferase [Tateyamaria pelophila]